MLPFFFITNWMQDPPPAKRLRLTLLQWSGAEPAVSPRLACTCIFRRGHRHREVGVPKVMWCVKEQNLIPNSYCLSPSVKRLTTMPITRRNECGNAFLYSVIFTEPPPYARDHSKCWGVKGWTAWNDSYIQKASNVGWLAHEKYPINISAPLLFPLSLQLRAGFSFTWFLSFCEHLYRKLYLHMIKVGEGNQYIEPLSLF